MKPASPDLIALLMSRSFFQADLYTFSLGNLGTNVLRYTSGDRDIQCNGQTFLSGGAVGPYFNREASRAKAHWKIGAEVDTLTIDIIPGAAQLFGVPLLQAIRNGVFDGSVLSLDRVYMPLSNYGDTTRGIVRMFLGRVANVDFGRSLATISINSHLELLDLQLPRNLFSPGCTNHLGDASCTVILNNFKTTGTVLSGSTNSTLNASLIGTFPVGAFDLGKVVFTSGSVGGLSQTARVCVFGSPNIIQFIGFLPGAPSPGDTFNIFFGCDKTTGPNGCTKFINIHNFRGFPVIPQPSTAV